MSVAAHKAAFAAQLRLRGEAVIYQTTSGDTIRGLKALRGQTNFREQNNQTGSVRVIRSTDFIFDPAAFREAVGHWPDDGDLLTVEPPTEIHGLTSTTFRVTPFNGEPIYRIDPTYTRLRIHTTEYAETEV